MDGKPNSGRPPSIFARGGLYVLIQALLLALLFFGPSNLSGTKIWTGPISLWFTWLGWILFLGGSIFSVVAAFQLGSNLTPLPGPKPGAKFVRKGLYRFVRHPIYFGVILFSFAWFLITQGELSLAYAGLIFLFFDIKSRKEEQWLVTTFPEYADYQKHVHKLLPLIY
jgi:protein-S-isoprenylcysteine O-methyltransferase Ste14